MALASERARTRWEALGLMLQAWPLVARVRWALWFEPFPRFYARWNQESARLLPLDSPPEAQRGEPSVEERRDAWNRAFAVQRAARLFPRASCLTQALVLQRMLARIGQPCTIRFGANRQGEENARRATGTLQAHAWIEWRQRVLIGGDATSGDVARWKPFPSAAPDAGASPSSSP